MLDDHSGRPPEAEPPPVYLMADGTQTLCRCPYCSTAFVPQTRNQVTCGAKLCRSRRNDATRKQLRGTKPEQVLKDRARFQRWAESQGLSRKRNPWLVGAPPYSGLMPALGFTMAFSNGRVLEHAHIRGLHAVLSDLLEREPQPKHAWWALVPTRHGCGWGALVYQHDAAAQLLAQQRHAVRLFDHDLELMLGHYWRPKFPAVAKRGHRKLRIDTITPCVFRAEGGTVPRPVPTKTGLYSCLVNDLPPRIGVTIAPELLVLDVLEHDTRPERLWVGEKQGTVVGWVGSCVVDTNAVGEFMLRCAAHGPGLGGRTAYGFGRVVVSHV